MEKKKNVETVAFTGTALNMFVKCKLISVLFISFCCLYFVICASSPIICAILGRPHLIAQEHRKQGQHRLCLWILFY